MVEEKFKYTEKGLPVVSQQTIKSIVDRYVGRKMGNGETDWGNYLTEVQHRLVREQPDLVEFIESQVNNKYPIEMHHPILESLIVVYCLLETQAEAYKMEQKLAQKE
jgi:hypothetical protein